MIRILPTTITKMVRANYVLLIIALLGSVQAQPFTIDLEKLELQYPSQASFRIDSLIDVRVNPGTLGYIFNRKTKNYSTIFPTNSVESSLNKLLQSENNISGENLTLRLNRLFVYHKNRYGKRGLAAEVSITFISRINGKYYDLFTSTKTIRSEVKYGNKLASVFIQEALDSCLFHYDKRKAAGKLTPTLITNSELTLRYSPEQAELMKVPFYKKGLFYSYYDLRDYTVDSETDFKIDLTKVAYHEPREAKLKFEDKAMRRKEIYAFSNGSSLFLKTGGYYTEVIDTTNGFWLNQHPDFIEGSDYYGGVASAGAIGGILGGVVGGAIASGIYALVADNPPNNNKYILDIERGVVVPHDFPAPGKATSQILFYGSSFLSENDTISLSIDGSKLIRLWRDQYYVYETDDKCLPVKACITYSNEETCEIITPIILNTAMARCQIKGNKGKIELLGPRNQTEIKEAIKSGEATQVFE